MQDSTKLNEARIKLTKHLETNYYQVFREYHYKDIEPRIFVEELLGEVEGKSCKIVENYRIFTFVTSLFIQIDDAEYWRTHKRWFYNENWEFQPFSYNMPILRDEIKCPRNLETMKYIARCLASKIGFVRVDLYEYQNKVFVGELTFTPCGGVGKWSGDWDNKLGSLWNLA